MKKFLIAIVLAASLIGNAQAQNPCANMLFPSVDSLISFTNIYIRNSAIQSFTNLRLNSALVGGWQWLKCLQANGIDSLHIVDAAGSDPDTLKVYKNHVFSYYKLLPAGGGGSDG